MRLYRGHCDVYAGWEPLTTDSMDYVAAVLQPVAYSALDAGSRWLLEWRSSDGRGFTACGVRVTLDLVDRTRAVRGPVYVGAWREEDGRAPWISTVNPASAYRFLVVTPSWFVDCNGVELGAWVGDPFSLQDVREARERGERII